MSDEAKQTPTPPHAWASGVRSGSNSGDPDGADEVDRMPGRGQYDPADVISVYMGARASAIQRNRTAARAAARAPGRPQPS